MAEEDYTSRTSTRIAGTRVNYLLEKALRDFRTGKLSSGKVLSPVDSYDIPSYIAQSPDEKRDAGED